MRRAIAWVMTWLGLMGVLGIPAFVSYALQLGCEFGAAAGCQTPLAQMWRRYLTEPEAMLFLAPMATATLVLGLGLRLHRQVSAQRKTAGTRPKVGR